MRSGAEPPARTQTAMPSGPSVTRSTTRLSIGGVPSVSRSSGRRPRKPPISSAEQRERQQRGRPGAGHASSSATSKKLIQPSSANSD